MRFQSLLSLCAVSAAALFSTAFIWPFNNADSLESKTLTSEWTFQRDCDSTAQTVSLPHCWNTIDAADGGTAVRSVNGEGYWRGTATYTRDLKLTPRNNNRYFLYFEGSSITTDVRVNNQKAGTHSGSFGAFCYEITTLLNPEKNILSVSVDNAVNPDIPPLSGDFSVQGGIYRPVTLIEKPNLCIYPSELGTLGVSFTQGILNNDKGELGVTVDISGKFLKNTEVVVTVEDRNGSTVMEKIIPFEYRHVTAIPERYTVADTVTVTNPVRWDGIQNPYLYRVTTALRHNGKIIDEVTQHWGFRTLEIDPKRGFILNGKVIKLRGVNRHQDKEFKGWALSQKDEINDIKMIVDMGANALRCAHYPHSSHIYRLCDKAGLIVWAEIPIVDITRDNEVFFKNAKNQLNEMIAQHRNHPSIAMWSISNELHNGPYAKTSRGQDKLMSEMLDICQKTDPSRPCVMAANRFHPENKIPDHLGFNTYPGWYSGVPSDMSKLIGEWCVAYPNKGICVSEYGAGASIRHHEYPVKRPKTTGQWHPEEWQNICHEGQYRGIKNAPAQCFGSFVWNMFDFASDAKKEGDHMGRNDKGLVTYDRKIAKDAYYFYQANWTTDPMTYITSRRFMTRPAGKMPFKVYSNCERAELFLDGLSLGTQKPNDIAVFEWQNVDLTPGNHTVEVRAVKNGKTVSDSCDFTVTAP